MQKRKQKGCVFYFAIAIISLFLLLFTAIALFTQLKDVQTFLVQKIGNTLSDQFSGKIHINQVDIQFFKSVKVHGIYVEDEKGDTLLFAKTATVDISLFSILKKKLIVDEIYLEDIKMDIHPVEGDSLLNYQALLNIFSSTPDNELDNQQESPWEFNLSSIQLKNGTFSYTDIKRSQDAHFKVGYFKAGISQFDLPSKKIVIDRIVLDNSNILLQKYEQSSTAETNENELIILSQFPFPSSEWELSVSSIHLMENTIDYLVNPSFPNPDYFDPQNIRLDIHQFSINNFLWNTDSLMLGIQQIALEESKTFQLTKGSGALIWSTNGFSIPDFRLQTPESTIHVHGYFQLMEKSPFSLLTNSNALLDVNEIYLSPEDLNYFIPDLSDLFRDEQPLIIKGKIKKEKERIVFQQLFAGNESLAQLHLDGSMPINKSKGQYQITAALRSSHVDRLYPLLTPEKPALPTDKLPNEGLLQTTMTITGEEVTIKDFSINLDSALFAQLSGIIKLTNPTRNQIDAEININTLQISPSIINQFAANEIFDLQIATSPIMTSGKILMDSSQVYWKGDVLSDWAQLMGEFRYIFEKPSLNDHLSANIDFHFNNLQPLGKTYHAFGLISGKADFSTSLADNQAVDLTAALYLDTLSYANYPYQRINLLLNGYEDTWKLDATINDRNVQMENCLSLTLKDTATLSSLTSRLDSVNLFELGLSEKPLSLKANMEVGTKGLDADHFAGKMQIAGFEIQYDTSFWLSDSAFLQWFLEPDRDKQLILESDIVTAKIGGRFDFEHIMPAFLDYLENIGLQGINNYVKVDSGIYGDNYQSVSWKVNYTNFDRKACIFLPQISEDTPVGLSGSFHSSQKRLEFQGDMPEIRVADYQFEDIQIHAFGDSCSFNTNFYVGDWKTEKELTAKNLLLETSLIPGLFYAHFTGTLGKEQRKGTVEISVVPKKEEIGTSFFALLRLLEWPIEEKPIDSLLLIAQIPETADSSSMRVISKIRGTNLSLNGHSILLDKKDAWLHHFSIEKAQLEGLTPYLGENITQVKGQLTGKITLESSKKQLIPRGQLALNQLGFFSPMTGIHYSFQPANIDLTSEQISWTPIVLMDGDDGRLKIQGHIGHRELQDFSMNIDYYSDNFDFFRSEEITDQFFYGALSGQTSGKIRGGLQNPAIELNFKTLTPSNLKLLPLAVEESAFTESSIKFGKPMFRSAEHRQAQREGRTAEPFEFQFTSNIQLTPDFQLQVQIDPEGGDQFSCNGSGNLSARVDKNGKPSLYGTFTIEKGAYLFTYQGLVKKSFSLESGSTVQFAGDPYDATFDISAILEVSTPIYPLFARESSLTKAEIQRAKKPALIHLILQISGDIEAPILSFDIRPASGSRDILDNLLIQKLHQLKQQESEWNKQVFSLLLFSSFMSESGNAQTAGFSETIESSIYSSLNNLISAQLNKLAAKYLKGTDLTIGMSSYAVEEDKSRKRVNEMEVQLSRQFLNDRMQLSIGGNIDFSGSQQGRQQSYRTMVGDFVLEYYLNDAKTYSLRIFHLNDVNILEDEMQYKTGAGIQFKKNLPYQSQKKK